MVELDHERDLVRVAPREGPQHAERRGDAVAAALDRQADDVLRVEQVDVRAEGRGAGVLDALVDRQDREVAGAAEAAVVEEALEVDQHAGVPVGGA